MSVGPRADPGVQTPEIVNNTDRSVLDFLFMYASVHNLYMCIYDYYWPAYNYT